MVGPGKMILIIMAFILPHGMSLQVGSMRPATVTRYHRIALSPVVEFKAAGVVQDHGRSRQATYLQMVKSDVRRAYHGGNTVAAMAGGSCILAVIGSAAPALAQENYTEDFAQGVGALFSGPFLIALPIIAGVVVATAIAAFIFFTSQPREYDD